jgi:hypothetical protein
MKGFRRLLRRFFVTVLVIVAVVAAVTYAVRAYMSRVGGRELAAVNARLDAAEPGWRLEAIEAARDRAAPPADQNSAPLVLKVAELIEGNKGWKTWQGSEEWFARGVLDPHLPSEKLQEKMLAQKEGTAAARQQARDIRRLPTGQHALHFQENPYLTLLPHAQKCREVATLLEYDALLAAVENDSDAGIRAAHAALNVGRSIGDEPLLISQLVRMACGGVSARSAMQVLAWGTPKQGLAELQVAYREEADEPWVLYGMRGERAAMHRAFEGLESGKLSADDLAMLGIQKPGPAQHAAFHLYKGMLPGDHAKALEILTAYVEAAKLPPHEQRDAFAAVPIPPGPPEDFRYIVTRLLVPACQKVSQTGIRCRVELLCASIAIACERFRQANGRWPNDLAEIPRDILPDVPSDPYTGQPLRYRRFDDGIAVYSVGDGDADFARRQVEQKSPLAGLGIGCRLWDPDKRGQPPLPEPKQPPDDLPPEPEQP